MEFILKPKAQEILNLGGSYNIPENREDLQEFADNLACSDGFGYGLFDGGYIHPSDIIEDENQLKQLQEAILLVGKYKTLWERIATET